MESKDMGTFIVISKSSFKAWLLEVQARTDYWVSYLSWHSKPPKCQISSIGCPTWDVT